MELITTQMNALAAPRRFAEHYSQSYYKERGLFREEALALLALEPSEITPERIASIIGNDSWTQINCDECDQPTDAAVIVGAGPNWDRNPSTVCLDCVRKSAALAEATMTRGNDAGASELGQDPLALWLAGRDAWEAVCQKEIADWEDGWGTREKQAAAFALRVLRRRVRELTPPQTAAPA